VGGFDGGLAETNPCVIVVNRARVPKITDFEGLTAVEWASRLLPAGDQLESFKSWFSKPTTHGLPVRSCTSCMYAVLFHHLC
jgi:hypothetical protein